MITIMITYLNASLPKRFPNSFSSVFRTNVDVLHVDASTLPGWVSEEEEDVAN